MTLLVCVSVPWVVCCALHRQLPVKDLQRTADKFDSQDKTLASKQKQLVFGFVPKDFAFASLGKGRQVELLAIESP